MVDQIAEQLTGLAARVGLEPTRILQVGPGRATLQAQDRAGRLFVLKTADAPGALTGDVEANRLLAAEGLPVPEIVASVDGAPSLLVLRWIDGDPMTAGSAVGAQREAGRILRTVHALPGGPPFSGRPTIAAWIAAWTEEVAAWWPSVGGTDAQVRGFRGWLDDLTPVLERRGGSLTLFDGRAEHFLVRDGHVVGLIDLHDVGPGDPAMDLAVVGMTESALIPEVLKGYRVEGDHGGDLDELISFYLQLRRLAGAEWLVRNGAPSTARRLLRLADGQPPAEGVDAGGADVGRADADGEGGVDVVESPRR
jgi:aminoglycoside phosphotransferase (APT) family kinase protein